MRHFFAFVTAAMTVFTSYACSVQEGNSVDVNLTLFNRSNSAGSLLYGGRSDGVTAALNELHVTISKVTLTPCLTVQRGPRDLLRGFGDALLPAAYAHSASTSDSLGTPHVISFVDSGGAWALGNLLPSSAVCGVRLQFTPADDDAVGLPADKLMVGKTARAQMSLNRANNVQDNYLQDTDFSLTRNYPLFGGTASGSGVIIMISVDVPTVLRAGLEGDLAMAPSARWVTAVADATSASRVK